MCNTLFFRFSNTALNQATVTPPVPVTIFSYEGLRLHVAYIAHYVIRIKKHLHNGIKMIKIKSNRKEYESLHPYIGRVHIIQVKFLFPLSPSPNYS